jgi:hypothetical protein
LAADVDDEGDAEEQRALALQFEQPAKKGTAVMLHTNVLGMVFGAYSSTAVMLHDSSTQMHVGMGVVE